MLSPSPPPSVPTDSPPSPASLFQGFGAILLLPPALGKGMGTVPSAPLCHQRGFGGVLSVPGGVFNWCLLIVVVPALGGTGMR